MDPGSIATLISSVGFPIAACCALFYLLNKQTETFNELKVVMTKLIERLDIEDVDIKIK